MQVVFIDPTDSLELPKFRGYTVVVCKTLTKFKYFHVSSIEEVHDIISNVEGYYYHRQNLSDPYKYIVITRRYYNEVGQPSHFLR